MFATWYARSPAEQDSWKLIGTTWQEPTGYLLIDRWMLGWCSKCINLVRQHRFASRAEIPLLYWQMTAKFGWNLMQSICRWSIKVTQAESNFHTSFKLLLNSILWSVTALQISTWLGTLDKHSSRNAHYITISRCPYLTLAAKGNVLHCWFKSDVVQQRYVESMQQWLSEWWCWRMYSKCLRNSGYNEHPTSYLCRSYEVLFQPC